MALRSVVTLLQDTGDEGLSTQRRRHAIVGPMTEAHQVDAQGLLRVLAGLGEVVANRFHLGLQAAQRRRRSAQPPDRAAL